jgi:hypothetical protein
MKHIALIVAGVIIAGILSVSTALAQRQGGAPPALPLAPGASQADVDKALLAAPPGLKDQATVIKWKSDFTYDTLRKGTNRLVCFDLSGFPLEQPFSVECTSIANIDRKAQNLRAEAAGDRKKSEAMLDAMEKSGTRVKPEYGSVWYELGGPDQQNARGHRMIAVPGATTQSTGLPDNPKQGGAWIMNAGTMKAHVMIP